MSGFPGALSAPLARLLHIGAGDGAELAAWQAAGAGAITLVEADPDAARALAARCADMPGVRVVAGAVSADATPRPFRIANLPGLSSFRAPAELRALFPGLRIRSQAVVTPLDPVALVAGLEAGEGAAALVIEAPGEALGILQALAAAGMLDRFEAIRLQEGREPLYEGAPPAAAIRDWLHAAGFEAEFEPAPEDPDRPRLIARRDVAALDRAAEIGMLRADLAEAEAELARQAARAEAALAERDRAEAALEAMQADHAETESRAGSRAAALVAERDAAQAALEALRAELGAELGQVLEQAREQAAAEAARIEAMAAEHAAEIKAMAADHAARLEAAAAGQSEARAEAAALKADRDAARAEAETLKAETETLQRQLGQAWQKVEERQADLKLAQQNLSVALRMQGMREADLAELQDRYGALLARTGAQDALLDRIASSLDAAAKAAPKAAAGPAPRRKARDG